MVGAEKYIAPFYISHNYKRRMKRIIAFFIFLCAITINATAQGWIGTWATAPQTVVKSFMPYNNNMSNRSVRQVVKVSIGGDMIRLKLSNIYSTEPVVIRSIYIAHAQDSFTIDPKSAKYLKFSNQYKATIPAGKSITSDALPYDLKSLQRLAITINYTSAPTVPTVHMGSRTTSYIMKGVTNAHSNFEKAFRENHWYNISAIIGNSITDGKCSTDNAQNRWPDVMSEMLQLKYKITNQGVLNLGIGNNRVVVPGGFGALAKERFDKDVLAQAGVKKVIIFEGINDIGAAKSGYSETVARQLIESYQAMIKKAKARRLKVYLGTITPFKGAGYYSPFHEAARQTVNEWIRNQAKNKEVDGILDFAKLLQDPEDDRRMKKEYVSNDWLHPNPTGYKAMGTYAAEIIK